jgi:hypothetical protein
MIHAQDKRLVCRTSHSKLAADIQNGGSHSSGQNRSVNRHYNFRIIIEVRIGGAMFLYVTVHSVLF